jgi:drug/metabolite transporter (DMT)-like permease
VEHRDRPVLALGLRLTAALLMATLTMLVKYASDVGIALPEIMFWRQAVTVPVLFAWLWVTSGLARLRTDRLRSHGLRAMTGMCGMLCGFGAATLLPLAEATILSFTTPLFAVILTAVVLREHVGPWRWLSVLCGFIGVIIIAQPGNGAMPIFGALVGLAGAFLVSIISFQLRDLGRTEEPVQITFWFAAFGAPLMGLFMPFFMEAHTPGQWGVLIAVGLVGTAGQLFLAASLRYGAVASVIIMDYTALIWATLYGWFVWDRLPPFAMWLGAPLIIAAGIIIVWRERLLARRVPPTATFEVD